MLPPPKTRAEISAEMGLFSILSFSVLLDDSTDQEMIRSIPVAGIKGYYTFTAAVAGRRIRGCKIQLLPLVDTLPQSQAWLIATNSKAGYALNEFLRERGQQGKVIFTLAKALVSSIYSYVDFFHGETVTIAYISNTFERGYKIHFPIAVRYLLRSHTGAIRKSGQWLIAPNQTVAFDSREIGLAEPFTGYLELYADVRHLNSKVAEFFHFHCDYLNEVGVATIHQSGLQPWPAGTRFVRGIVPCDHQSQLTASLFNKKNERPIVCTAILRQTKKGQRVLATKELPGIAKGNLALVNINRLFAEDLTEESENADVVIVPDAPMHRPNFYRHPCDRRQAWTAVEHAAGSNDQELSSEVGIARLGAHKWICAIPILPSAFELNTSIFYIEDNLARQHDFTFEIYDEAGIRLLAESVHCEFGQCINIAGWISRRLPSLSRGGLLKIVPCQAWRVRQAVTSCLALSGGRAIEDLPPLFAAGVRRTCHSSGSGATYGAIPRSRQFTQNNSAGQSSAMISIRS
jgi:hypothetical protein